VKHGCYIAKAGLLRPQPIVLLLRRQPVPTGERGVEYCKDRMPGIGKMPTGERGVEYCKDRMSKMGADCCRVSKYRKMTGGERV